MFAASSQFWVLHSVSSPVKQFQSIYCALQANDPAWHRLRPNHTLRLALAQKDVVEFPVITVVLPEEISDLNILGPGSKSNEQQAATL